MERGGQKSPLFRRYSLWTAPCCLTLPAFSRVKTVKGEGKKNYILSSNTQAILYPLSTCAVQQWLLMHIAQNFRGQGLLVSKKHKLVCGGKEKKIYQIAMAATTACPDYLLFFMTLLPLPTDHCGQNCVHCPKNMFVFYPSKRMM